MEYLSQKIATSSKKSKGFGNYYISDALKNEDNKEIMELIDWLGYYPHSYQLSDTPGNKEINKICPKSYAYYKDKNYSIFIQSKYIGLDYNKKIRYGNYIAHSIFLDKKDLDFNPIDWCNSESFIDFVENDGSTEVRDFYFSNFKKNSNYSALNICSKIKKIDNINNILKNILYNFLLCKDNNKSLLIYYENEYSLVKDLLSSLFYLLPSNLRKQITFNTLAINFVYHLDVYCFSSFSNVKKEKIINDNNKKNYGHYIDLNSLKVNSFNTDSEYVEYIVGLFINGKIEEYKTFSNFILKMDVNDFNITRLNYITKIYKNDFPFSEINEIINTVYLNLSDSEIVANFLSDLLQRLVNRNKSDDISLIQNIIINFSKQYDLDKYLSLYLKSVMIDSNNELINNLKFLTKNLNNNKIKELLFGEDFFRNLVTLSSNTTIKVLSFFIEFCNKNNSDLDVQFYNLIIRYIYNCNQSNFLSQLLSTLLKMENNITIDLSLHILKQRRLSKIYKKTITTFFVNNYSDNIENIKDLFSANITFTQLILTDFIREYEVKSNNFIQDYLFLHHKLKFDKTSGTYDIFQKHLNNYSIESLGKIFIKSNLNSKSSISNCFYTQIENKMLIDDYVINSQLINIFSKINIPVIDTLEVLSKNPLLFYIIQVIQNKKNREIEVDINFIQAKNIIENKMVHFQDKIEEKLEVWCTYLINKKYLNLKKIIDSFEFYPESKKGALYLKLKSIREKSSLVHKLNPLSLFKKRSSNDE